MVHRLAVVAAVGLFASTSVTRGEEARVRTAADIAREFPPFSSHDLVPGGLGDREPALQIDFPGAARTRALPKGQAVVCVEVDDTGKATDFLATSYTDEVFAQALKQKLEIVTFKAPVVKGIAVPGRVELGYIFEAAGSAMSAVDDMNNLASKIEGVDIVYAAVGEDAIDGKLEVTHLAYPRLPESFEAPSDKLVKAYVSFYIDEEGHVRAPNVESAPSPLLIPGAIKAMLHWSFKPPLSKGKPVLVFTGRPISFIPSTPPALKTVPTEKKD